MLFRFLKYQTVDWHWEDDGSEGHGWYNPGDVIVGEIIKRDNEGVWLKVYSDDDAIVIVEPNSIEVLEKFDRWSGEEPRCCHLCKQPLPINCFFYGGSSTKVMCHHCWLDCNEHMNHFSQRYELDKSSGDWVRTYPVLRTE